MKSYDCHFQFNVIVQTHGRDEDGAIKNIEKFLNKEVIHGAENIMCCGVDFDRDNIDITEVDNGWFELNLLWSGYWSIDGENEIEVRKIAEGFLNKSLTPFYQMLEIEQDKHNRFEFKGLKNEQVTDIV